MLTLAGLLAVALTLAVLYGAGTALESVNAPKHDSAYCKDNPYAPTCGAPKVYR